MTNKNVKLRKLLNAALLGAICVSPLVGGVVAKAAPTRHAPANGYRDKGRNSNRDHKKNTDRNHADFQTMTGQVSNVKGQQFDLRVGNTTYNVFASSRLPNGLRQGDTVRVYGERYGDNDLRNANVSVTGNNNRGNWNNKNNNNNRWNNNQGNNNRNNNNNHGNNQSGNYQTFSGIVTNVESSSKFDVRVGSTTYNVYPSGRINGQISRNDTVRIYGQRFGDNDIRNANVVIVRNNNNGNWNNNNHGNNQSGNYQTFSGTVTNVESSSKFDVRIGSTTYNVYPSGNAGRRVEKGNVVRVYGQRFGNNDIRNANIVVVRNR